MVGRNEISIRKWSYCDIYAANRTRKEAPSFLLLHGFIEHGCSRRQYGGQQDSDSWARFGHSCPVGELQDFLQPCQALGRRRGEGKTKVFYGNPLEPNQVRD